jgi:hypothetical protein
LLPDNTSESESAASNHKLRPVVPELDGVMIDPDILEYPTVPTLLSIFPLMSTVWIAG